MSTATVSLFAYFAGVMKTKNVVVDMVIIRYEGKGVIEPVDWHYHADGPVETYFACLSYECCC